MHLLFLLFCCILTASAQSFEQIQLADKQVKIAKKAADSLLKKEFQAQNLSYPPNNMFFQVYKAEALFEVWVQNAENEPYQLFKTYPICDMSGKLGPKRQQGDKQVPEGFYHISEFNPNSRYGLSLKVSYPNQSDLLLKTNTQAGGLIYIHGSCTSIGCISFKNEFVAELYWLSVKINRNGNKRIPVYIFPTRLNDYKFALLSAQYSANKSLIAFWSNLRDGYERLQATRFPLQFTIDKAGKYVFAE